MAKVSIEQKELIMENLAHDLKSPVFSQINALNLLLKDKNFTISDTQRELLSDILTSNIFMKEMILNMLSGFRVKKTKINLTINNIQETINFVIKSIEHNLYENNHKLTIKNLCTSPYAEYDEIEIKRVLVNLLTNAAKHSCKGSEIILETKMQAGSLIVSVINQGKIKYNDINDIFKPYVTSTKSNSKNSHGLGLYISKQIIEAHFGHISVENLKNNFVRFSFDIPIINTNL